MSKIDKRYFLFGAQITTPFIAIWALLYYGFSVWLLASLVVFFLMRCVGSVITYHRVLGHRTHIMHPVVEAICTAFGFFGSLSSPVEFCASHTNHHKFVDTEKDPHPVKYLGWKTMFPIFWNESGPDGGDIRTVVRLRRNKIAYFFHRYHWMLLPLPLLLLLISVKVFMFFYLIPLALTLWSLSLSTLNHDKNGPKDMGTLYGILTAGEHKHVWHHTNPHDTSGEGWLDTVASLIAKRNTK